jgi:hypothetical protein
VFRVRRPPSPPQDRSRVRKGRGSHPAGWDPGLGLRSVRRGVFPAGRCGSAGESCPVPLRVGAGGPPASGKAYGSRFLDIPTPEKFYLPRSFFARPPCSILRSPVAVPRDVIPDRNQSRIPCLPAPASALAASCGSRLSAPSSQCPLPAASCLLPPAPCPLLPGRCLLPAACCSLPAVFCAPAAIRLLLLPSHLRSRLSARGSPRFLCFPLTPPSVGATFALVARPPHASGGEPWLSPASASNGNQTALWGRRSPEGRNCSVGRKSSISNLRPFLRPPVPHLPALRIHPFRTSTAPRSRLR